MKTVTMLFVFTAAAMAQEEGEALLERACTKCHSIDVTTRHGNSKDRWQDIVDTMISRGAALTDSEADRLIDYLAKNLGPRVNVNKAPAADLAKALDVSAEVAAAVVEFRTKNGPFKSIANLKAVPALAGKDIDSKKAGIEFGR